MVRKRNKCHNHLPNALWSIRPLKLHYHREASTKGRGVRAGLIILHSQKETQGSESWSSCPKGTKPKSDNSCLLKADFSTQAFYALFFFFLGIFKVKHSQEADI